jgi:hypothetical protein
MLLSTQPIDIHETWYECGANAGNQNFALYKFLQSGLQPAAILVLQYQYFICQID